MLRGGRDVCLSFTTLSITDGFVALGLATARACGFSLHAARVRFLEQTRGKFGFCAGYLFSSARSGLYFLLRKLAFDPGAEVYVTGFTCEVVANAVIQAGYKPIFIDIDPQDYGMDPARLKEKITVRGKAVIIQHSFGIPAQVKELAAIAREAGLICIEDCAVALDLPIDGKLAGTWGDFALFSFELTKPITCGRGGLLTVNPGSAQTTELIANLDQGYESVPEQPLGYGLQLLIQTGISAFLTLPHFYRFGKYVASFCYQTGIFKNSTSSQELNAQMPSQYLLKLSGSQTILLSRQWKRLSKISAHRREATAFYTGCFADGSTGNGFHSLPLIRFPVRVDRRYRDLVISHAREQGLEIGEWFTAPLSSPEVEAGKFGYVAGTCPVAEKICAEIVNLPTHPRARRQDWELAANVTSTLGQV